jgi:lantibiotic modifying enzyme
MRPVTVLVLWALVLIPTAAPSSHETAGVMRASSDTENTAALEVVRMAADSLLVRHESMPTGGWAWRSAIQAPHFQTDRDVGAASIGEGLLAAYAVTRDLRYLRAALQAGDFLLGVAERDSGGLRWPDWVDPDGRRSATHYTSFDDGAAGISDYLLHLFTVTGEPRFRTAALRGMRWLIAQAVGSSCSQGACSWRWTDDPSNDVAYNGLGMGQAGIVLSLDGFADVTGDNTWRRYARAGAARLRALTGNGRRPLPQGSEHPGVHETGFLNGSAGAAYMFLERYARDHNVVDLQTAMRLMRWVNGQAETVRPGGLRWPLAADDAAAGAGFELGAAGVAWVNLGVAQATANRSYREVAQRAGVWLRNAATAGGLWHELPGDVGTPIHVGVDSGAAGIGWVLEDLAAAGIEPAANRSAARSALAALRARAVDDGLGSLWYENEADGTPALRAEPSWHWGSAGIAAFAARLAGWSSRGPGGQAHRVSAPSADMIRKE